MIKVSITEQAFVTPAAKQTTSCQYLRKNRGAAVKTRRYTKMKKPSVASMVWKKEHNVGCLVIDNYPNIDIDSFLALARLKAWDQRQNIFKRKFQL